MDKRIEKIQDKVKEFETLLQENDLSYNLRTSIEVVVEDTDRGVVAVPVEFFDGRLTVSFKTFGYDKLDEAIDFINSLNEVKST